MLSVLGKEMGMATVLQKEPWVGVLGGSGFA